MATDGKKPSPGYGIGRRNAYKDEFSYYANIFVPCGFPYLGERQVLVCRRDSCYIPMGELCESGIEKEKPAIEVKTIIRGGRVRKKIIHNRNKI